MIEHKKSIIIMFVFFAFPIPVSLISWIGTIISVANIGMVEWSKLRESLQALIALVTMLLAGTYLFTYIISLGKTLKNKKISWVSFLPVVHIALFSLSLGLWKWIDGK